MPIKQVGTLAILGLQAFALELEQISQGRRRGGTLNPEPSCRHENSHQIAAPVGSLPRGDGCEALRQTHGAELRELGAALSALPRRLPEVLSEGEVHRVFIHLQGTSALVGKVLYGSGWRLKEALRLRI
jgi:hypothetical protein